MNGIQCTGITYNDGRKEILYYSDPVLAIDNVGHISYPMLSRSDIETIKNVTLDKLNDTLSKYF